MKNFAVIGGGLMGTAFAERLLKLGSNVKLYARNKVKSTKAEILDLVTHDLNIAVKDAECIIIALKDYQSILDVFSNSNINAKVLVLQTATILPSENIQLSDFFSEQEFLEAPFMGSVNNALNGNMNFMVSAPELSETAKSVLKLFSEDFHYYKDYGKASTIKLAINQLIVAATPAFCLSLAMVEQSGLEAEDFMKVLRQTHVYSKAYDNRLKRFEEADYTKPNFEIANLLKDGKLAAKLATSLKLNNSSLEAANKIAEKAVNIQGADADYGIIYEVIKKEA